MKIANNMNEDLIQQDLDQDGIWGTLQEEEERHRLYTRLMRLHFLASIFMGIQAIAYGIIGTSSKVTPSVGFPSSCQGPICQPDLETLPSFDATSFVVIFVALAAVDHLLTCVIAYNYPITTKFWLFLIGSNPLRWCEYAISASTMAITIAILSGNGLTAS